MTRSLEKNQVPINKYFSAKEQKINDKYDCKNTKQIQQ